jgi:hypothetical protein
VPEGERAHSKSRLSLSWKPVVTTLGAWKLLPLVSFLEQSRHDEWQVQLRCTLATTPLAERWSELLAVARHEAALFVGMSLLYWRSR